MWNHANDSTEAFDAINANFRVMFQTLFGGGMGEMRLTDEENLAECRHRYCGLPSGQETTERRCCCRAARSH